MKKKYEPAELEIVWFNVFDVITTSYSPVLPDDEDEGSIGGGYNPGGWT